MRACSWWPWSVRSSGHCFVEPSLGRRNVGTAGPFQRSNAPGDAAAFRLRGSGEPDGAAERVFDPLLVQWWGAWYPGSEPGGGGYVAQRMLAAKNERHATGAVLFFNAAHYALRPWPWIIVGLASLIVFPDVAGWNASFRTCRHTS